MCDVISPRNDTVHLLDELKKQRTDLSLFVSVLRLVSLRTPATTPTPPMSAKAIDAMNPLDDLEDSFAKRV